jgi:hypothetical protein
MRKVLAGALPVALAATALAGGATANGGKGDRSAAKTAGAVRVTVAAGQDERFAFSAKDRGAAADDRGKLHYRNATAGFSYRARLACVRVEGQTARFGYVIPSKNRVPAAIRGLGIVVQVVDNGSPGAGKDTVGYVSGPAAIAAACDTTAVPSAAAIMSGNVKVKAAGASTKASRKDRKHRKHRKDRDGDD